MNIYEFYEAMGRIAEEACLLPGKGIYGEDYEWTLEKKKAMPLHYKLEGLVLILYKNCTDAEFKKNHPSIEKSIFCVNPDESDYEMIEGWVVMQMAKNNLKFMFILNFYILLFKINKKYII